MPKKIRVYELAHELGLTNKEALDLCLSLGMGVKSHSSSIEDAQADRARRKADREGLRRPVQPEEPAPVKKAAAKKAPAKKNAPREITSERPTGTTVEESSPVAPAATAPAAAPASGDTTPSATAARSGPRLVTSRPASEQPTAPAAPPPRTLRALARPDGSAACGAGSAGGAAAPRGAGCRRGSGPDHSRVPPPRVGRRRVRPRPGGRRPVRRVEPSHLRPAVRRARSPASRSRHRRGPAGVDLHPLRAPARGPRVATARAPAPGAGAPRPAPAGEGTAAGAAADRPVDMPVAAGEVPVAVRRLVAADREWAEADRTSADRVGAVATSKSSSRRSSPRTCRRPPRCRTPR